MKFADGTRVNRKNEAVYLGCAINDKADIKIEIGKRIGVCMALLKKLDLF